MPRSLTTSVRLMNHGTGRVADKPSSVLGINANSPGRIHEVGGAVQNIRIEVNSALKPNRVLADEPADVLIEVTRSVFIDSGLLVELSPSELKRVGERARRRSQFSKSVIRVRGGDRCRRVGPDFWILLPKGSYLKVVVPPLVPGTTA